MSFLFGNKVTFFLFFPNIILLVNTQTNCIAIVCTGKWSVSGEILMKNKVLLSPPNRNMEISFSFLKKK